MPTNKSKFITFFPDISFFSSIILMWVLKATLPLYKLWSFPLTLIWWCVAVIGFITMTQLLQQQKHNTTSTNAGYAPSNLTTTGAYAFSRNPYYLVCLVTLLCIALGFGSVSAFLAPIIYFLIINFAVIPTEETLLEEKFNDKYLKYRTRVRRWI